MGGRVEYKYLVPNEYQASMRADIEPYLSPDPFTEAATKGDPVPPAFWVCLPESVDPRGPKAGGSDR